MRTRDSLAALLRLARSARKLKIDDFAGAIDPRHLQTLEAAKVSTTIETLEAVAQILGVNPISLLVLSSSFGTHTSVAELLKEIESDVQGLAALNVTADAFAAEFLDGQLVSRPAGPQVNQEKLAAVRACKGQGMTMSEAAKKLGMPATTLRRYWFRD